MKFMDTIHNKNVKLLRYKGKQYKILEYNEKVHAQFNFFPLLSLINDKYLENFFGYLEQYYDILNVMYYEYPSSLNVVGGSLFHIPIQLEYIFCREDVIKSFFKKLELEPDINNVKKKMESQMSNRILVGINSDVPQKIRSNNVHQTYIAVIKFYNNLLEEKTIRKFTKDEAIKEVKNLFVLKEGEKVDDIFIGKAFDNFWKNFPDKYKAGPGNPNYKNK